jgi:hypothetical protein
MQRQRSPDGVPNLAQGVAAWNGKGQDWLLALASVPRAFEQVRRDYRG